MKNDLISRSALLRDPYFQEDRYPGSHLMRMAVREQRAVDAEKVVRCKACKIQQVCRFAELLGEDGYCSVGQRRAEDDKA